MATGEDVAKARDIRESVEPAQLRFCQQKIRELSVPMRLAAVERLFGGEKIIFYFLAESRVDFRALVRELAREYRTRIEMKQIGARDEAKLLGDYEHCGRELCCRRFIRTLEPVTIRMAKIQKATLDPSKISGACGRLMCCLRFENAIYQQLKRQLPRKGRKVKTPKGEGEVINYDIIAQTVLVEESTGEKVTYKVEELSWSHRERGRARGAGGDQPAGDTLRKSVPREPGETGSSREPGPEAATETRDSDSRRRSRGSRGEPQEGDERA
jgi:cell fate regulator YaaT (PSP1 superfamily)